MCWQEVCNNLSQRRRKLVTQQLHQKIQLDEHKQNITKLDAQYNTKKEQLKRSFDEALSKLDKETDELRRSTILKYKADAAATIDSISTMERQAQALTQRLQQLTGWHIFLSATEKINVCM